MVSQMSEPYTKKRKRASLVCENCKKKKVKCDKGHPCSQCIRAKMTSSCVYENNNGSPENDISGSTLPYINSAKNPLTFATNNGGKVNRRPAVQPKEEVTIKKDELENLKGRLQQIESLLLTQASRVKSPSQFSESRLEPRDGFDNNSPGLPELTDKLPPYPTKKRKTSIQLPPIKWNMPDIKSEFPHEEMLFGTTPSSVDSLNTYSTQSTRNSSVEHNMFVGVNPYGDESETINFYEDYTSIHVQEPMRRINFGPFAWSSLMKKDYGLRLLWDYTLKQKEKSAKESNFGMMFSQSRHELTQENTNVITSTYDSDKTSETFFKKKALETDGYDDMVPFSNVLKARSNAHEKTAKLNENALPLGLTFYEGSLGKDLRLSDKIQLHLIDKIRIMLPTKKVIWKLIERYFTWLYPFIPYLDEQTLIDDVSKIIGPKSYEDVKIQQINIERRLDLAHIGILLVVLRLSYLSLFCNKTSVNEERLNTNDPNPELQDMKFLLSNPININIIDIAQLCLDQFQLLRKSSFPVLQLGIYLRVYHMYAPEDGDGTDGGDAQVLNAILIQMAYSLGLNREPDNFPDVCNDPKMNHLGRKIWHSLTFFDSYLGFCFGSPLSIDNMYSDTKMPFLEKGNENTIDPVMDRNVTQSFFNCGGSCMSMKELLLLVLDVKGRIKMPELSKMLSSLELIMYDSFGSLEDCLKPLEQSCHAYVFRRNMNTKIYLSIKTFFLSLYFHLYLYYEEKNFNLSFFYLKKMLLISTSEIMPRYFDLLGNSEIICDFIINPTLEMIIHKSNQVNLACIVKTNFVIYKMTRDNSHNEKMIVDPNYRLKFRTLCKLSNCFTRCAEFSIEAISKISNRYYYAWRITKAQTYLLKTITNKDFYIDSYEEGKQLCCERLAIEQMEDLISICETALVKVGKCDVKSKEFAAEFSNIFSSATTTPGNSDSRTASSYSTMPSTISSDGGFNNKSANYRNESIYKGFECNYVDNAEIDKLWFQMLSLKHDNKLLEETGDPFSRFDNQRLPSFGMSPTAPRVENNNDHDNKMATGFGRTLESTPLSSQNLNSNYDRYGFDLEQATHFDIFSELPFDQIFSNPDRVSGM